MYIIKNIFFCFFFGSIITHIITHIIASELKVGGIGGSSRVVVFVTRIAHQPESDIRGRMADEVRTVIKVGVVVALVVRALVRALIRMVLAVVLVVVVLAVLVVVVLAVLAVSWSECGG
jgi:hypothetical protein